MSVSIPKKDPATDSYHLITVKISGVIEDPSTWTEGHLVHVFRANGEIVAKYSDKTVTGYDSSTVFNDTGIKKIKFLLKAASHNTLSNERLYYKVYRQVTDGSYKAKIGPSLENLDERAYPCIDLGSSELKTLPDTA